MPMLHRLATLRDDVIFFIYLYQSWKYKIDYTRVNEFGQGGEEDNTERTKAEKSLSASPDDHSANDSKTNQPLSAVQTVTTSTGADVAKDGMKGKRRR